LISGIPVIQKFLGYLGVIIYCIVGFVFFFTFSHSILIRKIRDKTFTIGFLSIALIAFFLFYPLAQARSQIGLGSDRDEAISIAVKELLKFHNPYNFNHPTYFGNPISSLPGSIFIHVPAQLLFHNTVYMEPLILVIAIALFYRYDSTKIKYLIGAVFYSPVFWQDFLTGGDFATLSILTYVVLKFFLKKVKTKEKMDSISYGLILGICLCTRATMALFLLPLVINPALGKNLIERFRLLSMPLITFCVLILGFASWDFANFTPIKTLGKSGGIFQTEVSILLLSVYYTFIVLCTRVIKTASFDLEKFLAPLGFLITIIPTVSYDPWSIYYSFSFGFLAFIAYSDSKRT
jgi:hypothetical protein